MWNIELPDTLYLSGESSHDEIQALVNEVSANKVVAIDTETTGLSKWQDIPLYWSLAWGERRATMRADTLPFFRDVFAQQDKWWVLANAKYDNHILGNFGITLAGEWHDVQVMHALLYEDKPHKLKFICKHLLDWTWADFEDTFGKITKNNPPEAVMMKAEQEDMNLLIEYAANDAWGTLKAFYNMKAQLEREFTFSLFNNKPPYINTLWDFFHKIEVPYTKVLWKMERRGIKVNMAQFDKARPEAEKKIKEVEKEIVKTAGYMLNPASPMQLRKYFMEVEKLEPLSYTKGGKTGNRQPQTNEAFLSYYRRESPMADLILTHREYTKLLGTYINGLSDKVDPWDRIHANFNQDVARTGRLSSSDPNLQNIPRPENDHWNLRSAFVTEPGWKMLAADYGQLEMRLLAAASLEESMIDVFRRGWDIHSGNAALMYDVPYEDITAGKKLAKDVGDIPASELEGEVEKLSAGMSQRGSFDLVQYIKDCSEHRNDAKSIGFGLNYGMGEGRLAATLGVSREVAAAKIVKYKDTYPAVENFMYEAIEEGRKYGYSFTLMGRRRNIPMIASSRKNEQAMGERLAVNTQIQGSAADVCRMAQINIDAMGLDRDYDCHAVLQVHDELVFECPAEVLHIVKPEIEELMAHPFCVELACPLEAEAGTGDSWGEAK